MSLAPPPDRKRTLARVGLLLAAGVALVLGARSYLTGPVTYDENGVSFEYPRAWEPVTGPFTPPAGIGLVWVQGFALDDVNGAGVAEATVPTPIPAALLLPAAKESLEPALRDAVAAAGGTLTGPAPIEVGGKPALEYRITGYAVGTTDADVSLALVPDGTSIYFIGCQSTGAHAAEVDDGCNLIRTTFSA